MPGTSSSSDLIPRSFSSATVARTSDTCKAVCVNVPGEGSCAGYTKTRNWPSPTVRPSWGGRLGDPMTTFETDYLVIGAGALGMGFVDTLVPRTDADVVLVDRHHSPGGHWNDDYEFVRLHQPSAYYGCDSTPLGSAHLADSGPNAGF